MIMNHSDCRRKADKYRKLARGTHLYAQNCFKLGEYDLAIQYETEASQYEALFRNYQKLGRQRQS